MTVGNRIRELREAREWSQATLTAALNERMEAQWHKNTLTKVETGQRGLGFDEASVLADVLGVRLDDLRENGADRDEEAARAAFAQWQRTFANNVDAFSKHVQLLPALRSRLANVQWHPDMVLWVETAQSAVDTVELVVQDREVIGFANASNDPVVTDGQR